MEEPQIGLLLVEELNNRACLQWGRVNNIPIYPSTKTVTFPTTFTNTCYNVIYFSNFSTDKISDIFKGFTSVGRITKSNFVISTSTLNGGNWLAIGF